MVALVVAPDAIARRKSLHVTTDRLDNAHHVASDDERETEIHGKSASANIRVDWIDCHCNHLYQRPRGTNHGFWHVTKDDIFGRAQLLYVGSFHLSLLAGSRT